ncbi:MAG: hypothetical protein KF905_06560 [Flavobacteriales bacterium]|nr:hypothetical protein [Flavobacteriales bacterium]
MSMVEVPYSIGADAANTHEFDLKDLGDRRYVHVASVGAYNGRKQTYGYHSDVKVEDYDRQFREKLRKLNPPQRVWDFLDYHKAHFEKTGQEVAVFLDHLKYNVLHQLVQHYATSPNTIVARDWFNKIMDNIHKRNAIERAEFLAAAYAYAIKQKPDSPTFQAVDHKFIKDELGFDEAKCKRLRDELDQDGLIKIVAGNKAFRILDAGRRALERAEADRAASITYNSINANNSNVQIQSNSPNATQTANVGNQLAETRAFAERVTAKLDEIQQLITAEQFVSLKADLEFLKEKLDEPKPRLPLIAQLAQGIIGSLPSELLGALAGSLLG